MKNGAVAKKNGIKVYAIKYRSPTRYKTELRRAIKNIKALEIQSLMFGVYPTKWKKTDAPMLAFALKIGVNAASTWIPWGGGYSPLVFLCDDWILREHDKASKGITDYGGNERQELVKGKKNGTYLSAFQRIDIINEASVLLQRKKLIPTELFKTLLQ